MNARPILRGEIYYADLHPVKGSEQGGRRPVLILQNDIGNKHSPTTIVCVITSKSKTDIPTHVVLGPRFGLTQDSMALLEQIRTIDKTRLREFVGTVDDPEILRRLDETIHISFGLK